MTVPGKQSEKVSSTVKMCTQGKSEPDTSNKQMWEANFSSYVGPADVVLCICLRACNIHSSIFVYGAEAVPTNGKWGVVQPLQKTPQLCENFQG